MRTTATLVSTAALSLALAAGCVPLEGGESSVQQALPTADGVSIDVPAEFKAVGDTAEFYRVTRQLSEDLNGGAGWILTLVHAIVQYPATSVDGNVYTWGPHSDALDPAEWRLTVTENLDGTYDWVLDSRSKIEEAAEFATIIAGNSEPGIDDHRGRGAFSVDFDTAERIDPDGNDGEGRLEVVYDLGDRNGDPVGLVMRAEVDQANDDGTSEIASFEYIYAEQPDGAGELGFGIHGDMDENGSSENMLIHSRWHADGSGRADIAASGDDLGDLVVFASECWDNRFGRTFYADSVNWLETEGEEAACAFATAEYHEDKPADQ